MGKAMLILLLLGVAHARMVVNEEALADACPDSDNGVPAAAIIDAKDPRYASYQEISDNLEKWMNLSINPCEDFYGYTCKKGQKAKLSGPFDESDLDDVITQINAYKDTKYFANAPKPLTQIKHLYDKCVKPDATQAQVDASNKKKLEALKKKTGVNFPMLYQTERPTALNAANLGNLLGYPINDLGDGSLVQVYIDTDWKTPDQNPARVYVDQPWQMYYQYVYDDWTTEWRTKIINEIEGDMIALAIQFGLRTDKKALRADATAVADMEYALRNYVTDDDTRRQSERSYNLQTLGDLQKAAPGYNWLNLLNTALARANSPEKIVNSLQIVVQEPDMIAKLAKDIAAKKAPFDTATVANYVYYRATQSLLGSSAPSKYRSDKNQIKEGVEVTKRLQRKIPRRRTGGPRIRKQPKHKDMAVIVEATKMSKARLPTDEQWDCSDFVNEMMPRASDRVFIDQIYPTPDSRNQIKTEVFAVAQSIFNGFRTQLNQLNWMSDESKKGAYKKIENIVVSIAYSDWITDDAQLTAYYKGLAITDSSNTIQAYDAINDFYLTQQVENFRLNNPRDRSDFGEDATMETNAFYSPSTNSITFLAGIIHPPFYSPQYPASINFGGFGIVAGHELTHGFDDEGVQWDDIGALNAWMDDASNKEFTEMAQCVVDEYSGFCPDKGICLDGVNTQGENIADNGGIQAAYKAFKSTESYNGPDPRLPGFGSKFTNDQLFFLSFAYVWCDAPETDADYEDDIADDPHAPALYRILGTIQNFPAFRTAFNCPVGSAYAPKKHCDVWTSPPK